MAAGASSGATVGTLSTTDPDGDINFIYTLVSGTGSTDNSSFSIAGSTLKTAAFLSKSSYSIRVRSTDQGGLYFEKIFTITLTVGNQAPTVNVPNSVTVSKNGSFAFTGVNAISVGDADSNGKAEQLSLSVSDGTLSVSTTAGLKFTSGATNSAKMTVTGTIAALNTALAGLVYTPTPGYSGSDAISVTINDGGNSNGPANSTPRSVTLAVIGDFKFDEVTETDAHTLQLPTTS